MRLYGPERQWAVRGADSDADWDARVRTRLGVVADALVGIEAGLVAVLPRFGGYHERFAAALRDGRVDEPSGSCHQVWFELHEDLIATLGIDRAAEGSF